jgi:dynein heavy chain, axonemal
MLQQPISPISLHPDVCRITSYPSAAFPQSVLESGLKITIENPSGVRAGMERIYQADPVCDPAFFEGCQNERAFKALVFGLSFFHCVAGGRKQYGPIGWNIPYQFNANDLRISMLQLRMFLDEYSEVPKALLTYTCGECNYGGKVTDDKDRRTLMTLLQDFYQPDTWLKERYTFPSPRNTRHQSLNDIYQTAAYSCGSGDGVMQISRLQESTDALGTVHHSRDVSTCWVL